MDVANSVADAIYRLGFVNQAEQTAGSWVTPAELYQWADEAAKRLARETGAFAAYDDSIAVEAGTASYALPSNHVFTLMAAIVYPSGAMQLLRMTAVRDLWALDGNQQTTSGDPQRASLDAGGVGTITLYPIPIQAGTLGQVLAEFPGTIAAGSSTVALAAPMQDFFTFRILAGARGKESPNADQAMAAHFAERADLYSQVAEHLWGPGQ
jgi:hypothetical protein